MQNDTAWRARAWVCVIYSPKGGSFENQIHFLCGMAVPGVMKSIPLDQQPDARVCIAEHAVRSDQLCNGKLLPRGVGKLAKTGCSPMKIRSAGRQKSSQLIRWIAKYFG